MTADDPKPGSPERVAINWFRDAETYVRDRDLDGAINAAKSGIAILKALKRKAPPG